MQAVNRAAKQNIEPDAEETSGFEFPGLLDLRWWR